MASCGINLGPSHATSRSMVSHKGTKPRRDCPHSARVHPFCGRDFANQVSFLQKMIMICSNHDQRFHPLPVLLTVPSWWIGSAIFPIVKRARIHRFSANFLRFARFFERGHSSKNHPFLVRPTRLQAVFAPPTNCAGIAGLLVSSNGMTPSGRAA